MSRFVGQPVLQVRQDRKGRTGVAELTCGVLPGMEHPPVLRPETTQPGDLDTVGKVGVSADYKCRVL